MLQTNFKMTSKADIIDERQANLPLPDDPPQTKQQLWETPGGSANAENVNVGSGRNVASDIDTSERATGASDARVDGNEQKTHTSGSNVGREAKDNLGGLPNDALAGKAKNASNAVNTTGEDYGYPKNDPSSGGDSKRAPQS